MYIGIRSQKMITFFAFAMLFFYMTTTSRHDPEHHSSGDCQQAVHLAWNQEQDQHALPCVPPHHCRHYHLLHHHAHGDALETDTAVVCWQYFVQGPMMIRTGGYILSSLMLVVISIDRYFIILRPFLMIFIITSRYISISQPLSTLNTGKQRNRAR